MKLLLDALTVWLVVTACHWFRVAVVAFFVLAWIGLLHGDGGDWFATVRGAAIGLFFGVVFAFSNELADASEK
jgi:hypothetical protein